MKSIGINKDVLEYLSGYLTIRDATITATKLYTKDDAFVIDISFELIHRKMDVLLSFTDIKKYAFYNDDTRGMYYVEHLKFFLTENGLIYLSTDPYDEQAQVSDDDNDFILAGKVEGFIAERDTRNF